MAAIFDLSLTLMPSSIYISYNAFMELEHVGGGSRLNLVAISRIQGGLWVLMYVLPVIGCHLEWLKYSSAVIIDISGYSAIIKSVRLITVSSTGFYLHSMI